MQLAEASSSSQINPLDSNTTRGLENADEEDCSFLLKLLQNQAFEYVLYALRAQGPLNEYKEALIQHLKTALLIDDEEFSSRIRLAANNPYLSRVAQQLNPLHDNFTKWIAFGNKSSLTDISDRINHKFRGRVSSTADALQKEISRHNAGVENWRKLLNELIFLPKKPYVPERLRDLLEYSSSSLPKNSLINKNKSDIKAGENVVAVKPQPQSEPVVVKKRIGRPPKNRNIISNLHKTETKVEPRQNFADEDGREKADTSLILVNGDSHRKLNDLAEISSKLPPITTTMKPALQYLGDKFREKLSPRLFDNEKIREGHFDDHSNHNVSPQNSFARSRTYFTRKSASNYLNSQDKEGLLNKRARTISADGEYLFEESLPDKKSKKFLDYDQTPCTSFSHQQGHPIPSSISPTPESFKTTSSLEFIPNGTPLTIFIKANQPSENVNNGAAIIEPSTNFVLLNSNSSSVQSNDNIQFQTFTPFIADKEALIASFPPSRENHQQEGGDMNNQEYEQPFERVELSGLDFLASTASLMAPIDTTMNRESTSFVDGSPAYSFENLNHRRSSSSTNEQIKDVILNNDVLTNSNKGISLNDCDQKSNICEPVNNKTGDLSSQSVPRKRGRPPKNKNKAQKAH